MQNNASAGPFEYSVVIRTLGCAGEKYGALIDSLREQTLPPKEVLVVTAEGCPLPPQRLGTERFVYTRKGMVHQRQFGMALARCDHLLVCDDDVSFEADFVEKLYRTSLATRAEIVIPRMLSPEDEESVPLRAAAKSVRDILCGNRYSSSKPSRYRLRIWDTGGYVRNVRLEKGRQYYSQSGHGACSLIERGAARRLEFEDEAWLEDVRYAMPDDQVMFYKAFLQGNRIAWCQEAVCRHLDAAGGSPVRSKDMVFAHARNFTVFWHRFLYRPCPGSLKKARLIGFLAYRVIFNGLYYTFAGPFRSRRFHDCATLFSGYRDAFRFIRSEAYRRLPAISDRRAKEATLV